MAGSTNLRQLYTKSSATTGSPLLHLASWRSLNTHTRLSLLAHDSATAGTILPCASVSTSPSNKSRTTLISGTPVIWCGSSDCGSVTLLRVSTLACAVLPPAFSAAFSPPQPDSASTAASATADKGKVCFIYLSFFILFFAENSMVKTLYIRGQIRFGSGISGDFRVDRRLNQTGDYRHDGHIGRRDFIAEKIRFMA